MSNESKCPGHNRAECVSCCWPKADLVWGENIGLSADDVRSLHAPSITTVDLATADADGFKSGLKSIGLLMGTAFRTLEQSGGRYKIVMEFESSDEAYAAYAEIAKAVQISQKD